MTAWWIQEEKVEISLHRGSPLDSETEVSYPGYARPRLPKTSQFWFEDFDQKNRTFRVCNTQPVLFTPCGLLETEQVVTHFGLWIAGVLCMSGALNMPIRLGKKNTRPTFWPGAIVIEHREAPESQDSGEE